MVSINIPLKETTSQLIEKYSWVNWSAIARASAKKRRIFEDYRKSKELTKEDWKFCEEIDWHPVDELPLKKSFIKKIEQDRKTSRYQNVAELKEKIFSEKNV